MFPHFPTISLTADSASVLSKPMAKQLAAWNGEVEKQTESERALMEERQTLNAPEKAAERLERAPEFAQRIAELRVERLRLHAAGSELAEKIVPLLVRIRDEARSAIAGVRDAVRADLIRIGYEHFQTARGLFPGNARVKAAIDLANSRAAAVLSLEQWQTQNAEASRQLKELLRAWSDKTFLDVITTTVSPLHLPVAQSSQSEP